MDSLDNPIHSPSSSIPHSSSPTHPRPHTSLYPFPYRFLPCLYLILHYCPGLSNTLIPYTLQSHSYISLTLHSHFTYSTSLASHPTPFSHHFAPSHFIPTPLYSHPTPLSPHFTPTSLYIHPPHSHSTFLPPHFTFTHLIPTPLYSLLHIPLTPFPFPLNFRFTPLQSFNPPTPTVFHPTSLPLFISL